MNWSELMKHKTVYLFPRVAIGYLLMLEKQNKQENWREEKKRVQIEPVRTETQSFEGEEW